MSNQPSITVIIPYKNNLKYLFSALHSVFKQTYNNLRICIIYDNENKLDLFKLKIFLKKIRIKKLPPIKIEINKKNLGAGFSRNVGIKKSNTEYLAFLDADDRWKKNKLKEQIYFMERNNLLFSHTTYNIINSENEVISKRVAKSKIAFDELLKSCDIGLSTVMVKTNFLKKNNYYFPKIKTKEDFVLWLKIIKDIKLIRGMKKTLTYYRKTNNSLSSDKFLSLVNGYKVYRNYMNFGRMRSVYFLILLSINFIKKNL